MTGYTYSPTGALAAGNTTITVSYTEGGVTKTTTQAITVTTINTTLNSNSWATIKAVSDAGKGDNYWDVGDTKTITINGTVQGFTFSNLSIAVFILGFNHNSDREETTGSISRSARSPTSWWACVIAITATMCQAVSV